MPKPYPYEKYEKTAYQIKVTRPDNGKRTTMRLGVISESLATEIGQKVDALVECIKYSTDITPRLHDWLSKLDDSMYAKFVQVGLLEPREKNRVPQLRVFLDDYCKSKEGGNGRSGGWKLRTSVNRKQCVNDLVQYFTAEAELGDINSGQAEDWYQWLQKKKPSGRGLAPATASKRMKDARQFFRYAVKKKLIDDNPFEDVRIPLQDNPARLVEVTRETIQQVLEQIDNPELRLIVALARYAGLRVPSEISALRWTDVNTVDKTLHVFASKTEHHKNGGRRICPLFKELLPFFDAVRPRDLKADDFVIKKYRGDDINLRTALQRKIKAAGLEPWPKLFQNLRANALTDLCETQPMHRVCRWLGNTIDVAMRHYVIIKKKEYEGLVPNSDSQNASKGA